MLAVDWKDSSAVEEERSAELAAFAEPVGVAAVVAVERVDNRVIFELAETADTAAGTVNFDSSYCHRPLE